MICEFALEPELVATWHDRKEYLFFDEKFGLRTGRIIAAYPKKDWKRYIWQAFRSSPYGQDQNAEKNLDSLLDDLTANIIKRPSTFPDINDWLKRAEAEHAVRPFHAILARENPRNNDDVISATDVAKKGHPRWPVPDDPPVIRKAGDLAAAVGTILRSGRHIVFIDPHFDPKEPRFKEPMEAYLKTIWDNRIDGDNPKVEIHTSIERFFRKYERERNPQEECKACKGLIKNMEKRLPDIIPLDKIVSVFVWKRRPSGQKLHNRYILSDACGIAFGTGSDQDDDPESSDKDDLHLLSAHKRLHWWDAYLGSMPKFDLVTSPEECPEECKGCKERKKPITNPVDINGEKN